MSPTGEMPRFPAAAPGEDEGQKRRRLPVSLRWVGDADGRLEVLDQTLLPGRIDWIACHDVDTVVEAIRSLRVRGAPAIGIAGAYGVAVTALAEARAIHDEDAALCAAIGRHGAAALPSGNLLTHCNTGALATGGAGTALAVITAAWDAGRRFTVFADETRPLFQGSRLTAWELVQRGIPVTVLVDSAAGHLLASGRIAAVVVGADRIAANGDTANKIGTYSLAVLAAAHGVPFFVAAPSSTFDLAIDSGADIPIEERAAAEVLAPLGVPAAPAGASAFNPAFDVTPARLIRGLVTERGVIAPVNRETIAAAVSSARPGSSTNPSSA